MTQINRINPKGKVILLETKYQKVIARRRLMKKLVIVSALILSFIVVPGAVCNAKTNALGILHFGVKVDYMEFTDSVLKDADLKKGTYLGAEIYSIILPYLYLGLEAGYSNPSGTSATILGNIDTELTYVPIELNAKVAFEPVKNLAIDVGGGVSINYAELKATAVGLTPVSEDDWLWGGQIFADINYIAGGVVYIGINGKYKIAEKGIKGYDVALSNWMVGGQIGFKF